MNEVLSVIVKSQQQSNIMQLAFFKNFKYYYKKSGCFYVIDNMLWSKKHLRLNFMQTYLDGKKQ